jgi:lipopolysaccharide export system protein LptA
MRLISRHFSHSIGAGLILTLPVLTLLVLSLPVLALESDRQEPLEIYADSTTGTFGDGTTTMTGNVDFRQGTLHITADEAEVRKADGSVQSMTIRGKPAFLEQEIEEQGLVQATATVIEYQVASGLVTLTGNADVKHPQYQISGDKLTYDLNIQHFQGSGGDEGDGRIHIKLDPEVLNMEKDKKDKQEQKKNQQKANSEQQDPSADDSEKDGD